MTVADTFGCVTVALFELQLLQCGASCLICWGQCWLLAPAVKAHGIDLHYFQYMIAKQSHFLVFPVVEACYVRYSVCVTVCSDSLCIKGEQECM